MDTQGASPRRNVLILGAAGRDFHNFNVFFRDRPSCRVVAFTATQIPGIAARTYPAALCGPGYPQGIPIYPESELAQLIADLRVDEVAFCYSDVTHGHVMHLASIAIAGGASFRLLGPRDTMLESPVPVIAVVAARTGAGKSTVTRYLAHSLKLAGRRPVVVRHPMPYGRFDRGVERYAEWEDFLAADLTFEEMEEYQPHVDDGTVVYAGVDYAHVLAQAAAEADVILWDGGNNDIPFFRPALTVTLLDPTRPGEEDAYFPGEANVRAADVLVIGKANAASAAQVGASREAGRALNPRATILEMDFAFSVDRPALVRDRKVLVVEDGPSVTHGGLAEAGGARAARQYGATLVDPRPHATGSIAAAYTQFPHLGPVMPALGYSTQQREDLRQSIANVPCDSIVLGTPADLVTLLGIEKPVARVSYQARDLPGASLSALVLERLQAAPHRNPEAA